MERDYKQEYKNYHGKPKQRKRRAHRNWARAQAEQKGLVEKGDNQDVHHIDGNPANRNIRNIKVLNKSSNRSFARTRTGKVKR
jgi:hypothetical protein